MYEANPGCTETNEGCYVKLQNDEELNDECLEIDDEVCGIIAPDNGGQPLIQGELRTDLESGNFQDNPDIFTMPRTN